MFWFHVIQLLFSICRFDIGMKCVGGMMLIVSEKEEFHS